MTNEIVILDYCTGQVYFYTLPWLTDDSTKIEDYIDSLGFRLSEIEWMGYGHHIEINDYRK